MENRLGSSEGGFDQEVQEGMTCLRSNPDVNERANVADATDDFTDSCDHVQADVDDILEVDYSKILDDNQWNDTQNNVSNHLYGVLHAIGASEKIRNERTQSATVQSILQNVMYHTAVMKRSTFYICGSFCEGTSTVGLCSDTDILCCDDLLPVVQYINDAPRYGFAYLIINEDTKPGYVKLQIMVNRTPVTTRNNSLVYETDGKGRCLLSHEKYYSVIYSEGERHGPATKNISSATHFEQDFVNSYRCLTIPKFANEWLHRKRINQWPSQEQLEEMGSQGCFVVGVGHPKSSTKNIEWRLSFTFQERLLMLGLNPTQFKCYILLKMIKKNIIKEQVGESITSYHLKTCMFYLIENSKIGLWTRKNLIYLVRSCLRLLLHWVEQENCPNYFVREENMFEKLDKETLKRVAFVLKPLLADGVSFLLSISCDELGKTLKQNRFLVYSLGILLNRCNLFPVQLQKMCFVLLSRARLHKYFNYKTVPKDCLLRVLNFQRYIERLDSVADYELVDVRMALVLLNPFISLTRAQSISSILLMNKGHTLRVTMKDFEKQIEQSKACDLISSKLVAATFYFHMNKLHSCESLLLSCETSLKSFVVSMCKCNQNASPNCLELEKKVVYENLTFKQMQEECRTICLHFLQSHSNLVHPVLRFEIYRSVMTNFRFGMFLTDWIIVDSKVYLYFMQYLLFQKINKPACKEYAKETLRRLIDTDNDLGHRETAYNLLGWIYIQETKYKEAYICYTLSWRIKPIHNAAKWHLLMMIHSLLDRETIYDRKWFK